MSPASFPCRTQDVCRLLGVSIFRVRGALMGGKIPAPHKDPGGVFWWSESDVENLRAALAIDRRRKAVSA
jgi:hypothetical protein